MPGDINKLDNITSADAQWLLHHLAQKIGTQQGTEQGYTEEQFKEQCKVINSVGNTFSAADASYIYSHVKEQESSNNYPITQTPIFNIEYVNTISNSNQTKVINSVNKWSEILNYTLPFNISPITVRVNFVDNGSDGTLGYAYIETTQTINNSEIFGETFPLIGVMFMNTHYGISENTLVHEMGHILGYGTIWGLPNVPKSSYIEDGVTKYYWTGENALREYKNYYTVAGGDSSVIVGIPIEDDGGAGTESVHFEEGASSTINSDNSRYINGIFHPGLGEELMTGVSNGSNTLSKITIGLLEDHGYNVNYNMADNYILELL